ncbi:TetR/AcrR family transcriptional regulator [Serratia sp. IR-2025]
MARPRQFNKQEVLLQIMKLFWKQGYESTSLSDIMRETGLSKSSLYDAFGNKRELFLAAFEIYRQLRIRTLEGYLTSQPDARSSIVYFFEMILGHARTQERPFGCMSCNEAVELAPHDDEVQELVERDFQGIEDALAAAIVRGKLDGSISQEKDSRMLARHMTVTHHGFMMMSRSRADFDRLKDTVAILLSLLD